MNEGIGLGCIIIVAAIVGPTVLGLIVSLIVGVLS